MGGGMGWVFRLGVFNVILRDIDGVQLCCISIYFRNW